MNDIAPRDVKQLELLRPMNIPTVGERYKQSLEKEKRLEAASRPVQQTSTKKTAEEPKGDSEKKSKKRKRASKKKAAPKIEVPENALDEEDDVQEGINWSDDEE